MEFLVVDLLVSCYPHLEAFRTLNGLLIYIVQHADYAFLRSYLDYLALKGEEFERSKTNSAKKLPFIGFRPRMLLTSLKTSHTNKWKDKTAILFDTLLTYLNLPSQPSQHRAIHRIRAIISENLPLRFSALGNVMKSIFREVNRKHTVINYFGDCLERMVSEGNTINRYIYNE